MQSPPTFRCIRGLSLAGALLATACCAATAPVQAAPTSPPTKPSSMHITIRIGADAVEAELVNNSATRDLLSRLPMTVKFEDFHATEKISYLPGKLDLSGTGTAGNAQIWDLMYYVPWGNLAVFYRPYSPSRDLVRLGRIVSNQPALTRASSFTATIERATARQLLMPQP